MTSCTLYKEQAVVVGLVAGVEQEAEVEPGVAAARPVAASEEPGRTGFSFRSTRTSMSTVWARIEIQKILCRPRKATTMSFVRVTAGFTDWARTSSLV